MKELQAIGELLRTQNNRLTNEPFFVVQHRVRTYGIDTDYDPEIAWLYADESVEVPEGVAKRLEAEYQETGKVNQDYRRVGYAEQWEYVTGCFTEKAADEWIKRRGHNYRGKLRTYAETNWHNPEMIAIRKFLASLPPEDKGQNGTQETATRSTDGSKQGV